MNDLLKLTIDGHGGMHRWEQISRISRGSAPLPHRGDHCADHTDPQHRTCGGVEPGRSLEPAPRSVR
jgi:hypothetical protein